MANRGVAVPTLLEHVAEIDQTLQAMETRLAEVRGELTTLEMGSVDEADLRAALEA